MKYTARETYCSDGVLARPLKREAVVLQVAVQDTHGMASL